MSLGYTWSQKFFERKYNTFDNVNSTKLCITYIRYWGKSVKNPVWRFQATQNTQKNLTYPKQIKI